MEKYTGRQIAIFSDAHGLYEPTYAALEDIKNRGITEIYSLGDNIGFGPHPDKVIDLLEEYNVKSIAGNSESYVTLGVEPFSCYFNVLRYQESLWTTSKLNEHQIGLIKAYPYSIELFVGGNKLALCHFANDIRIDFEWNDSWGYKASYDNGFEAYKQFLYTNSKEQFAEIREQIKKLGRDNPKVKGYLSAIDNPLLAKKRVTFFDALIQGHVHFKIYEESDKTKFYTIRAVGMAYEKNQLDTASYVILKEKTDNKGFDLEEVLVLFDREKMEYDILGSTNPCNTIRKYTGMVR